MARDRCHVRRQPHRARYDRVAIDAVLDAAQMAHVAFVDDGQPYCIPFLHARIGDVVYIHGSPGSRAMRILAGGAPACLTVTCLDGLVLARSAFEHSANYRSAVLLGRFAAVGDADARVAALEAFTNALVPGRWAEVRQPSPRELKATVILALPIAEASVKIRTGPPDDDDETEGQGTDADQATWAGVIPIEVGFGTPEAAPSLEPGPMLPPSVRALVDRT